MDHVKAPSYRSQIRWAIGTCVVLVLVPTLLYVAQVVRIHSARRELGSLVQKYHDEGDPTTPQELNRPPVPDAENGAINLREAFKLIDDEGEEWKTFDDESLDLPLTDEQSALVRSTIDHRKEVLDLVHAASGKPYVDWALRHQSPLLLNPDSAHLVKVRHLGRLLRGAALLATQEGRYDDAIRYIHETLYLSRAVAVNADQVASLVSIGIGDMAASVIVDVAPDLKIERNAHSASAADVLALINQLLDERPSRKARHEAMVIDRLITWDSCTAIVDGRFTEAGTSRRIGLSGWMRTPELLNDARSTLETMTLMLEKAEANSNWPDFERAFPKSTTDRPGVFAIELPALRGFVRAGYVNLNESRLAATVLAIRLFASRHAGLLPKTLDELVPVELTVVPMDPLASGSSPLLYHPDGPWPIVYSVGNNGRDDGGREPDPQASRKQNEATTDEVRHLRRRPKPTTAPSFPFVPPVVDN